MSERVAVIGDVHGCLDEFAELVWELREIHGVDHIVCLGDFLDKGPYPLECLRFAQEQKFDVVASNHEERHARWWRREKAKAETGKPNNMRPWHNPDDEAVNRNLTEVDIRWIETRPTWLEVWPRWVAVHGGFNPRLKLADQDPTKVIRMRYVNKDTGDHAPVEYTDALHATIPEGTVHWADQWRGPENVIYGHEAFDLKNPKVTAPCAPLGGATYGIDTGCVHGGHLTALVLPHQKVVQVKARRVYMPHPDLPA